MELLARRALGSGPPSRPRGPPPGAWHSQKPSACSASRPALAWSSGDPRRARVTRAPRARARPAAHLRGGFSCGRKAEVAMPAGQTDFYLNAQNTEFDYHILFWRKVDPPSRWRRARARGGALAWSFFYAVEMQESPCGLGNQREPLAVTGRISGDPRRARVTCFTAARARAAARFRGGFSYSRHAEGAV